MRVIGGSPNLNLENAAAIVAAYVSNNSLRPADLPDLIATVHSSLGLITAGGQPAAAAESPATPAVPIKKSVANDYVVCLEDGKKFKSLRRHLSSHHGLSPEQYRAKWGLASDHPIVAPSYSATRSQLARDSGLGVGARDAEPAQSTPAKSASGKPGRGRPRKSV